MTFDPEDPRVRYLIRNALRWHLTSFDATNRGEDADGVAEHGWSELEAAKIDGILADPQRLKEVLLAWVAFDESKPAERQNFRNCEEIKAILKDDFFQ